MATLKHFPNKFNKSRTHPVELPKFLCYFFKLRPPYKKRHSIVTGPPNNELDIALIHRWKEGLG